MMAQQVVWYELNKVMDNRLLKERTGYLLHGSPVEFE
jgi:hypothetical protein